MHGGEPQVTLTPYGQQRASASAAWPPPGTSSSSSSYAAPKTSKVLYPPPGSSSAISPGSALALSAAAPLQPPSPTGLRPGFGQQQASMALPSASQAVVPKAAGRGAQQWQGQGQAQHMQQPLAVAMAEQAMMDPIMREAIKRQAVVIGGHAADAAKYCGTKGLMAFQDYIQQGPQGVSVLCFVGGLATTVLGAMNVCNVFGTMLDPFHYILNVYVFVFGLVTACLEADTDRIGMLMAPFDRLAEPVTRAQAWLHNECRLLTRLRGRGFFYLYQGTLLVTQCVFCLLFLCGLYLVAMGAVCILMSCGITPDIEGMLMEASGGRGAAGGPPYSLVGGSDGLEGGSPMVGAALHEAFPRAEAAWKRHKERLPGKTCRELWALQKQATTGDCTEEKPSGMFNGSAKEQWRLWAALQGLPEQEAKAMFLERLRRDGVDF